MEKGKYFLVGKIISGHGIRGEVKVKSLTDFPERFSSPEPIWVKNKKGEMKILHPEKCRWFKGLCIIKFAEFANLNEALPYIRGDLLIAEEQLMPLPEGRYYFHQIIGLEVVLEDGLKIGQVVEILQPGANDVYVVNLNAKGRELLPDCKGELLLPVIDQVILQTDLEQGHLLVKLLAGM